MKLSFLFAALGFMLVMTLPTFSQPYSSSCAIALEKVDKARKALTPFKRSVELAQARERGAYGELAVCTGGGIYSVDRAVACNRSSWKAPRRTLEAIEAEDRYVQGRKEFEDLFAQAQDVCLND